MRIFTAAQIAILGGAEPTGRLAELIQIDHPSSVLRWSTLEADWTFGGVTWTGRGAVLETSGGGTGGGLEGEPITVTLTGADPGVAQLMLHAGMRGVMLTRQLVALRETGGALVQEGAALSVERGRCETPTLSGSPDEPTITLEASSTMFLTRRSNPFRLTPDGLRRYYADDTGADLVAGLVDFNPLARDRG